MGTKRSRRIYAAKSQAPSSPQTTNIPRPKDGSGRLCITLLDAVIMYKNVLEAIANKEIGHQDEDKSLKEFISFLRHKKFWLEPHELESALWACNILKERGELWMPEQVTFDEFVSNLLRFNPKLRFNKDYNLLERMARAPWQPVKETESKE